MDNTLHGTVSGKIVELTSDPGLQAGQKVEVVLHPVPNGTGGKKTAAGMLADVVGLDSSLREIEQARKSAQDRTDSL